MNLNNIDKAIRASRMGKKDICIKAGISRQTLDNILCGVDARISNIEAVARAIGVSPACFFDAPADDAHNVAIAGGHAQIGTVNTINEASANERLLTERIKMLEQQLADKRQQLEIAQATASKCLALIDKLTAH